MMEPSEEILSVQEDEEMLATSLAVEWATENTNHDNATPDCYVPEAEVDPTGTLVLMELLAAMESDNDGVTSILEGCEGIDMDEQDNSNNNAEEDDHQADEYTYEEASEHASIDRDIESGLERLGENEESGSDDDDSILVNMTIAAPPEERTRRAAAIQWLRLFFRILVFPVLVLVSVAIPVLLVMFCFALMFVALLVLLCVYYCCSPRGSDRTAVPFHVLVRQILEAVDDERNGLGEGSNATPKYAREQIQNAIVRRKLIQYECRDEGGNLIENDEVPSDEATREERMHQDMFPIAPDPSTLSKESTPSLNEDGSEKDGIDKDKEANKPVGLFGRRKRRQLQRKKQKETEAAINSRNETYNLRLAHRQITFQTDPPRNHSKLFLHRRTFVFSEPLIPQTMIQRDTSGSVNDLNESDEWFGSSNTSIAAAALTRRSELEQQAANNNNNDDDDDDDDSSSERYYFPMPLFLSDDDSSSASSSSSTSSNPITAAAPSTVSSDVSFFIDDGEAPGTLLSDERETDTEADPTAVIDVETGLINPSNDNDGTINTLSAKNDQSTDYSTGKDKFSAIPLASSGAIAEDDAIQDEISCSSEARTTTDDENHSIQSEGDTTPPKPFSTGITPLNDESKERMDRGDNLHDEDSETKKEGFAQEGSNGLESEHRVHVPFEPDVVASMVDSTDIEETKTEISVPEAPPIYAEEATSIVRVPPDEDPQEAGKTHSETLAQEDAAAELSSTESKTLELHLSLSFSPDARGTSTCCNICLLEYEIGDIVVWSRRPNGCHHAWHEDCLLDWLKRKPTCPHCRQEFFAIEDSPHQFAALSSEAVEDNSEAVHTILPESMHTIPAEVEDTATRPPSRYWW